MNIEYSILKYALFLGYFLNGSKYAILNPIPIKAHVQMTLQWIRCKNVQVFDKLAESMQARGNKKF